MYRVCTSDLSVQFYFEVFARSVYGRSKKIYNFQSFNEPIPISNASFLDMKKSSDVRKRNATLGGRKAPSEKNSVRSSRGASPANG